MTHLDTLVKCCVDCTLATRREAAQGTWAAEPARQMMTEVLHPCIVLGSVLIYLFNRINTEESCSVHLLGDTQV